MTSPPATPPEALEALEQIKGLANRFYYSRHARQQMRRRNVCESDVFSALRGARACSRETETKWKISGPDLDGVDLTMIVVIEDGVVVVTLF